MTMTRALLAASLFALCCSLQAQDASVDPSFNPGDPGFGFGDGPSNRIYAIAVQPDGKILISGDFIYYSGQPRVRIARLNADGTLDPTFDPGTGLTNSANCFAVLPDGKILIGGQFSITDGGTTRSRLARLFTNGDLDPSFNAWCSLSNVVITIGLQADGKVVVGGGITNCGVSRGIARLGPDGAQDSGFLSGTGTSAGSAVYASSIQPDGKIIIAGGFTTYKDTARLNIARLRPNGTLDNGFLPLGGTNGLIRNLALQPDGKVIITGEFTIPGNRIARLNADGSFDSNFNVAGSGADGIIYGAALQSDGKLIIGGTFTTYNGVNRAGLARLNPDGSLDETFNVGAGANAQVYCLALQSDGKSLVGGNFTAYGGTYRNYLARALSNGAADNGFLVGSSANGVVDCFAVQPDGQLLVGGKFTSYENVTRVGVARTSPLGAVDASFVPVLQGAVAFSSFLDMHPQPDGKCILTGEFYGYALHTGIIRLNADGSVDAGFQGSGAQGTVYSSVQQPDGKIIVVGGFLTVNGTLSRRLARLNPDGTLDASFNVGMGASGMVYSVALQPDGKILIGGLFTSYNGTPRSRIARINADGSLDTSFDPGAGANGGIWCIELTPEGRIMVAGDFTTYNGSACGRIARLHADGSPDPAFAPGTGTDNGIYAMVLQPDGEILIGGIFTAYNGTPRKLIARLHPNGSLDTAFDPGVGPTADNSFYLPTVNALMLQEDGRILVGGRFTAYNGSGRNRIARLMGTARANIRVHLEGPYTSGSMSDALRTLPSFPLTEPFTSMGYSETGYAPGATIAPSTLTTTGSNAIVDWVIVEMRLAATPNVVAASRAVLLQRDGDVVDLDGVSTVGFSGLAHGNYCVAVKPRTHLPVMLSASTPFAYGTSTATVDFALPATQVHDNDARKNVGGVMVLATGDASFNEELMYVGLGNDRDPILLRVGGSNPIATLAGYWPEDVNMDGIVKYVGSNNDRDPILLNIGGSNPTAVRSAQLP